jgi:hypothetical protein
VATKYQIFVSSTYGDLKSEREVVIKAILEMGHIPVGMEMFSAADEEQWRIIARHIEESDYYCVVVAHRYGSMTEGISYTQKEYEFAVRKGIPALGFIIDEGVSWPPEMVDKGQDAVLLAGFKSLVKSKPVSFWKSADDLYGKVSIAVTKQMTANPRDGWVRATGLAGPQVMSELSRLSAENAMLRNELSALTRRVTDDKTSEVKAALDDLIHRKVSLGYKYSTRDAEWSTAETSFGNVFYWLAPVLASEVDLQEAAKELSMQVREDLSRGWWTVAVNQLRSLFADFMALDLLEPSQRKHAVNDKAEYWTLTPFGHDVHKYARRLSLSEAAAEAPDAEATNDVTDPKVVSDAGPTNSPPLAGRSAKKAPAKKTPGR